MSFRLKIILGIILIQALLLIVLIAISLNFLKLSNEVELSKRASSLVSLFSVTARPLILEGNRTALQILSNTVAGQPGVEYVRIRHAGKVLAASGDPARLGQPFVEDFMVGDVSDGIFDTYATITADGRTLGQVEIGISIKEIATVTSAASRQISTVALIGMFFSILMSIALGNYFARQLHTLRNAARSIASGNIGYQLFIRGHDELAQTANAFNTMSRKLAVLYSEKQSALNRAEQTTVELRDNERRIQTILGHAMDGIITIDDLGLIDSFNPAAERIFGYSQAEVLGQNVTILMPERMRDRQEAFLREYLRSGSSTDNDKQRRREFIGRRQDGSIFPMELNLSEVRIEERALYIGIIRDITDRKRVEHELREAKDLALESARAKFEFIANVSHELRSPMKGVLGTINMLQQTGLSAQQQEYVHHINEAGDRLITIVNDILDFSRLESNRMKIESFDFDIRQSIENVCHGLRAAAQRKGLRLTYFIPCLAPFALRGDPARIRQVLINLVDNAIKYTEQGEVAVHVEMIEENSRQVRLKFVVSDTGVGLTPKARRRIFDGYFTAEGGPMTAHTGAGLGLAISKRLVEMMGGEIGVDSERGRGSVFWFTLMFDKQAPQLVESTQNYDELRGLKVLVVDSRDAWRDFLHRLMQAAGMEVHDAVSSIEALEDIIHQAENDEPYDLVILDMMMQDMTGLELARRIKSDVNISQARLIMVATTGYRGDSEEVRLAGVNGYLTAPIKERQLYDCMLAVMHLELDSEALITRHSLADNQLTEQGQILVIEEDLQEQKNLLTMFEELDYRPYFAASSTEAIEALSRHNYQYIIIDCKMECRDGFTVTDFIRNQRVHETERMSGKVMALVRPETTTQETEACLSVGIVEGTLDYPVSREGLVARLAH
ncbi:MAG: PAS domain S-box protein [Gammaproteobacteria bacterium]|nr:PAS domain S-box protein [Gammaproteobacteria bacterium]